MSVIDDINFDDETLWTADFGDELDPMVRLWILRLLVGLGCHRQFVRSRNFVDEGLACSLGLGKLIDLTGAAFDRNAALAEIGEQHKKAELSRARRASSHPLSRNLDRLGQMLNLSPDDRRILEFSVLINGSEALDNACDWLGRSLSRDHTIRALTKILGLSVRRVSDALSPQGILARSGILTVNTNGSSSLKSNLSLLSPTFADRMQSADGDPIELLRGVVALGSKADLDFSDYPHLSESLDLLHPYLKQSIEAKRQGVNVILYGPPGVGKTQLVRSMADALGCDLFEVACEDEDGDPINGERRLRACRAAQTLLSTRPSMLLFDEVEDVLNDNGGLFGPKSTAQTRKGWMNKMLEQSAIPTFWLSNTIEGVDPAFLRRFDMVIEVPIPPRSQRQRIIERACGDLIGASCAARIAESEQLAPAVVARASSVARVLGASLSPESIERALEHLIGNTLEAQGHRRLMRADPNRLPDTYDLSFLNPDSDLAAIAEGLRSSKMGRLCLYGPPGTGKTAFGRWLAQHLDLPLQVKRASDLISPFVGTTERNLAKAFQHAAQEGALLLIDEVDSFLRDRKEARASWEITQVNEMLTQMEAFPGIFIASTNLMEGLDSAALRRFDAKVRMGFLSPAQAAAMLRAQCAALKLEGPSTLDEATVRRMGQLTPGDFAALERQHRFRPISSAGQLVAMLGMEVALKGGQSRPIGFIH